MTLDLEARIFLTSLPPRPPRRTLSPDENRAFLRTLRDKFGEPHPVKLVRDILLDYSGRHIPARLYRPDEARLLPCLVYAHGGGWVLGDLDTHDSLCRELAALGECAVVSVDYRRPPEHPFPAALDDLNAAISSVFQSAGELQIDVARIAVGGDSAGGNLAAASCFRRPDHERLAHQLLILPVLDTDSSAWPSYKLFAEGYGMTADDMAWYLDQYIGPYRIEQDNPLVAPVRAHDLSGLPGATIITAECDILRDEGEAYARRLSEFGVSVTHRRFAGMFHAFYLYASVLEPARLARAYAASALRKAFDRRPPDSPLSARESPQNHGSDVH